MDTNGNIYRVSKEERKAMGFNEEEMSLGR